MIDDYDDDDEDCCGRMVVVFIIVFITSLSSLEMQVSWVAYLDDPMVGKWVGGVQWKKLHRTEKVSNLLLYSLLQSLT